MAELFFFQPAILQKKASEHFSGYRSASPFPHIVMDDLFPTPVLEEVLGEFPGPEDITWGSYKNAVEKKLACEDENLMGPAIRHLLAQCNSSAFLTFLEELTGIENLLPDPHFRGGGMHQILPGGYLKVHADFNWYPRLKVHRRLNLLVYLNKDWHEEYGGHLELWQRDMSACAKRVLPIFGRSVIFSTTDTAFHGHPDPLTCPPDRTRKSLALYYYTAVRPEDEQAPAHSTLFRARPGEQWTKATNSITSVLKKFVPPIITDMARHVRRSLRRT